MFLDRTGAQAGTAACARPHLLVCSPDTIWLWPGTALTEKRGDHVVPLPRDSLLAAACMFYGPAANHSDFALTVQRAAVLLSFGERTAAQKVVDRLYRQPLSADGAALAKAIGTRLGLAFREVPVPTFGRRLWSDELVDRVSRTYDNLSGTANSLAPAFARGTWDETKHPRWPHGAPSSQGGRFAPVKAGMGMPSAPPSGTPSPLTRPDHARIGHNGGPPLFDDAPLVPPEDPGQSTRWQVIKRIARWTATRIGILAGEDVAGGGLVGLLIDGAQIGIWIHDYLPYLEAYNDPPRTLAELRAAARGPGRPGYDVHHVVWQTDGAKDGITDKELQSGDNLVSISTLRHWELNSWFQRENKAYGGRTPRDYLRDKDFGERTRVGLDGLRQIGVLKP